MAQPHAAGVPVSGPRRTRPSFLSQWSTASPSRVLRPSAKVLPEHVRSHNRALVLQTLFTAGHYSRADIARSTGLTRVTVSELVCELMAEGLLVETGQREGARPGKPAILLDINRSSFQSSASISATSRCSAVRCSTSAATSCGERSCPRQASRGRPRSIRLSL